MDAGSTGPPGSRSLVSAAQRCRTQRQNGKTNHKVTEITPTQGWYRRQRFLQQQRQVGRSGLVFQSKCEFDDNWCIGCSVMSDPMFFQRRTVQNHNQVDARSTSASHRRGKKDFALTHPQSTQVRRLKGGARPLGFKVQLFLFFFIF